MCWAFFNRRREHMKDEVECNSVSKIPANIRSVWKVRSAELRMFATVFTLVGVCPSYSSAKLQWRHLQAGSSVTHLLALRVLMLGLDSIANPSAGMGLPSTMLLLRESVSSHELHLLLQKTQRENRSLCLQRCFGTSLPVPHDTSKWLTCACRLKDIGLKLLAQVRNSE